MWILTLRSPDGKPREYNLKAGKNTIGRGKDNDIVVSEISASRYHAEIDYDPKEDQLTIRDLESTNGTFVNRELLEQPNRLKHNDVIRIGMSVMSVTNLKQQKKSGTQEMGTRSLTRDFLLESVDQHAVLLYEVSSKLNTVLDLDTALREVSDMMQRTMGADRCGVILDNQFDHLSELGFPTTFAKTAIEERATVIVPEMSLYQGQLGISASLLRVRSILCVPIITGNDMIGLIYLYKTDPTGRPFDERDLQLAVAISHQAAMTIQRMRLLERVREEQRMRQLLERFVSPAEADYIMQDYMNTGQLYDLAERTITVLFADIADSTGLAERLGPRRFGEILNHYYQNMTDIIFEQDGLVDKYLGDGVMAVFGMSEPGSDPEGRAVTSGLRMIARVEEMWKDETEPIHIGVGINTGQVVAGYVRTKQRVEFTVLGDTVNVASGLQNKARPNRLFIGPATAAAVVGRFPTQRIGGIPVKGRTREIQAHEVLRELVAGKF
jgi:adenylate cyclase